MAREFASGIQHAEVAVLPTASANPRVTLAQGGKLWFSDGTNWIDLGAAGGGGGAVDYTVVTAGQTLADDTPLLVDGNGLADPNDAFVTAHLLFDGANASTEFPDGTGRTWTAVAQAQISTTSVWDATGAALFDGNTDAITPSTPATINLTGQFCVETAIRISGTKGTNSIVFLSSSDGSSTGGFALYIVASTRTLAVYSYVSNSVIITSSIALVDNTYTHVALTRDASNVLRLFVGGALAGSVTVATAFTTTAAARIGCSDTVATSGLSGRLGFFRVFSGIPLYTSAFTAPTTKAQIAYAAGQQILSFPLPAVVAAGDTFVVQVSAGPPVNVVASVDPGAGRKIVYGAGQSLPVADPITCAAGETIALVCLDSTTFELQTPGAVGVTGATGAGFNYVQPDEPVGALDGETWLDTDLDPLARANHTGTQAISTVTGLQTALDGKETSGAAAAAVAAHEALSDPHSQYLTPAEADTAYQPLDTQLSALAALSYAGNALKVVRVNAGATGFELETPAGGGGSPGGSTTQVQFNNAGAFGGAALTTIDAGGRIVHGSYFDVADINNPAAPGAGFLRMFARAQAGRMLPAIIGPSGLDTNLQPALFRNSIFMWSPSNTTGVSTNFGTSWTARNSGTGAAQAHPNQASTNALTSLGRATFSTGTTATGTSGIQSARLCIWRGNAAGLGGFFFFSRFGVETFRSDLQLFVGLSARNGNLGGEPSAQNNSVGLCKDSGDTNWTILTRNGSTATKTPLQTPLAVAAGDILDFIMFAPPNGSDVTFRLVNAVTGTVYADGQVVSATLPVSTTFMAMHASIRSTVGTTAALLALNRIYVETDL